MGKGGGGGRHDQQQLPEAHIPGRAVYLYNNNKSLKTNYTDKRLKRERELELFILQE